MEPVTTITISALLATLFVEAGKTLVAESVKFALEKRQDIKDRAVEIFRPELISLNLNDTQSSEEVKTLLAAKPEIAESVQDKAESNSELLKELLEVIKEHTGNNSSQITINAKNIAAAGNVTIQNQTNNFS